MRLALLRAAIRTMLQSSLDAQTKTTLEGNSKTSSTISSRSRSRAVLRGNHETDSEVAGQHWRLRLCGIADVDRRGVRVIWPQKDK
ncbi:hypothetical protein KC329_g60 [Hortaea werneckii]|nr:hypothetical protein KC329_g60 [Hortaea werneckii]